MAGSHEVRGSIPLGSTTDTRGARRRRRAPLFLLPGTERAYRTKSVSHSGASARAGAPFSFARTRRPIQAPGRKARPRRSWASRGRRARARPPRARGGRAGPVRAHRGDPRQGGDAFGAWPPRPRRARRGRSARGKQPPEGGAKAVDGIGADPDSAAAGSRTPASAACRRRPTSGGPLPRGGPRGDAAIEPANGAPKKGPIYRRASAGLGRLRREPDPCVRRRGGAMAHPALGCMGPARFGNAGLSP